MNLTAPRTPPRRAAALIGTLAIGAAVLAGCSAGTDGGAQAPPPPATRVAPPASSFDVAAAPLPLDRFRLTDDQTRFVSEARRTLLRRCAAEFRVTLPPHRAVPQVGPATRTERRYGVADLSLARTAGYHLGSRDPRAVDGKDRWLEQVSPDVETVVYGELVPGGTARRSSTAAGTVLLHGRAVPQGGCLERVRTALHEREVDRKGLVSTLDGDGWEKARLSAPVRRAAAAWSTCMRERGFDYSDPFDAINDHRFQGARPDDLEIATATSDVQCRQSSGLVEAWYREDVRIEKTLVASNARPLAAVVTAQHRMLEAARTALAPD